MTRPFRHMQHLYGWFKEWIFPLYKLLHTSQENLIKKKLCEVKVACDAAGFNPDERLAIEYKLALLNYFIVRRYQPEDSELGKQAYLKAKQTIGQEPQGSLSSVVQAHQLIVLASVWIRREFFEVDIAEVNILLDRIPAESRSQDLWFHLSTLGFDVGHLPWVELSYQELLSEATGWLDSRFWLRCNMMYLIMEGRVQKKDIIETIKRYEHPFHLRDMDTFFLPRLEPMGLIDAEILELLEKKKAELSVLETTIPDHTVPTDRVIKY